MESSEVIMDLLLRTEASDQVGHGHLFRSLTLAEAAKSAGLDVVFSELENTALELVLRAGHQARMFDSQYIKAVSFDFKRDVDRQIVLHYKKKGASVLLFDDHGPAREHADIVCDATMTPCMKSKLKHGSETKYLYGLKYAMLRKQFKHTHGLANPGKNKDPRLFVCLGGGQNYDTVRRLLQSLDDVGFRGPAIVLYNGNTFETEVLSLIVSQWKNTEILKQIDDVAAHMVSCDMVVTKLGNLMFEAMCVGVACVMLEPTLAHLELHRQLANTYQFWPLIELGLIKNVEFINLAKRIVNLLSDASALQKMGAMGAKLVDGKGCDRVLYALGFHKESSHDS